LSCISPNLRLSQIICSLRNALICPNFADGKHEVIVAATKINAEICGASDRLGTIEKGKLADLLVIEKDPLKDIKALRNARIIIQEGKIIKR